VIAIALKHFGSFCCSNPSRSSATVVLMQLFDAQGQRKYLTEGELRAFLRAAGCAPPLVRTFCLTLAFSGCRISEALRLTAARVDAAAGIVIFESLKKRRRGVFRAVPVPSDFLSSLEEVHDLKALRLKEDQDRNGRLWDWSRTTGWRRVREVMEAAEISGIQAMPKAVRHGFGIKAVTSEVPLNMTQKWLGHARLATTSIYTDATGPEERELARRMWT
jgi:integrase/recombinase XerD